MLSRVADSLYWMSRYFERADNSARVLEATHNLILDPAKFSTEQRWYRALTSFIPVRGEESTDPHHLLRRLAMGSTIVPQSPHASLQRVRMHVRCEKRSARKCGST